MLDDDAARDLALFAGLEWQEDDRAVLGPLMDATLVWADDERLDGIAAPIVAELWVDGLRGDIERALDEYERTHGEIPGARADLAAGPRSSRLALAYAKQGAVDLSGAPFVRGLCLCCVEDGLGSAHVEAHERIALDAAAAVVRDAEFDVDDPSYEARLQARKRLGDLAVLAEESLPRLAAAFRRLANEPLPPPDDDALWNAARRELYGDFTLPNE